MTVILVKKIPPAVKGVLSRWMIEVQPGIFVGTLSARTRSMLWEYLCQEVDTQTGFCHLIHKSNNAQGYIISVHGKAPKLLEDFDGIEFFIKPTKS